MKKKLFSLTIKKASLYLIIGIFFIAGCKSFFNKSLQDNIIFHSIDRGNIDPSEDNTVYYRIFSNKELYRKTPSGLYFESKKISSQMEPGRYLIRLERWELRNAKSGLPEFQKANNIYQHHEPFYLNIPEDQNVVISFGFDHKLKKIYKEIELKEK